MISCMQMAALTQSGGVYTDRPFNEVALSLHSLVKERLSVRSPSHLPINHRGCSCLAKTAVRRKCLAQRGNSHPSIWKPRADA